MSARDVLAEAIAGQNLYYGRHGTTPAGMGAAMSILSSLADRGYSLLATPQPEAAGEAGLREALVAVVRQFHGDAIGRIASHKPGSHQFCPDHFCVRVTAALQANAPEPAP